MEFEFKHSTLKKRYPLTISRGTCTESENLFVFIHRNGFTGIGEIAPAIAEKFTGVQLAEKTAKQLIDSDLENLSISEIWERGMQMNLATDTLAGIDMALWDLQAKECGVPLYKLLGLTNKCVPTSITIGINPPDVIRERVPEMLARTGTKFLKIKLGSPQGIEHDKEIYTTSAESAKNFNVSLRIDANGGWNLNDANEMATWLAKRNCDYIEQPFTPENNHLLPEFFKTSPLPLYIDESCRFASDVIKHKDYIHGVNLKLMKCGGLTEALRIAACAKACHLQLMIGCMSESSVSISAGAAMSSLCQHIDLDSHLNLNPDPSVEGAILQNGIITPSEKHGHGASLKNEF